MTWDEMDFWRIGEWQAAQEKLDDMDKAKVKYCPPRELIFAALDETPFDLVKVMFVGQDPYPDPLYSTGLAFSIPKKEKIFPPTLRILLKEYHDDLGYPEPVSGDLTKWCAEGVLLWNALPTCEAWKSKSHDDWDAWYYLTTEIITRLRDKGCVFVFFGGTARAFANILDEATNCVSIETSHPSPRAMLKAACPFTGSRIFSQVNDGLRKLSLGSIDWRLT